MNSRTLATKSGDYRTADPKKEYRIQGWGQALVFKCDGFKRHVCNCGANFDYYCELREHKEQHEH